METKWCYNAKTGEVFSYNVFKDGTTDFPRGTFMVYDDYLVTGFKSEQLARDASGDYALCLKCKSAKAVSHNTSRWCVVCNSELVPAITAKIDSCGIGKEKK